MKKRNTNKTVFTGITLIALGTSLINLLPGPAGPILIGIGAILIIPQLNKIKRKK
jgi:hypothetical protein